MKREMIMKQKIKKRRKEKPARVQALGALRCCFYPSEKKIILDRYRLRGSGWWETEKEVPFSLVHGLKKNKIWHIILFISGSPKFLVFVYKIIEVLSWILIWPRSQGGVDPGLTPDFSQKRGCGVNRGQPRANPDPDPVSWPRTMRGYDPDFFVRPRPRRGHDPGK